MAGVFGRLQDDLLDLKSWERAGKAALAGGVGRLGFGAIFTHVPYAKDLPGWAKAAIQAVGGAVAGVLGERYIGEAAAYGLIGGTSGAALASLGNMGVQMIDPAFKVELAAIESEVLSPSERAFLNGLPGESLREVAVEPANLLNEVAVEPALAGLNDAETAVLFS